jgi:DNA-binding transcriptional MerR regulator
MYGPSDRERLMFISAAKELGFALSEIEEILDHAAHGDSPCPMVRQIVEKRIEENRQKIHELKKLQKRMEGAVALWRTMKDGTPTGHSVCSLIEAFADAEQET